MVAMVAAPVAGHEAASEVPDDVRCLRITTGRFDAPGRDAVMPGLNGESVVIKNMCVASQPLRGWSVRDADGKTYAFADSSVLSGDSRVRLHSGTGTDTEADLYWGRTQGQVWNNVPPERAYLVDPSGAVASSWSIFQDRVLIGAGDIASCASGGDERTADLLDGIRGTVFTTGDNAYERGSATEYAECYDPSWGRHLARTRPTPGNHEYGTSGAAGYRGYFGARALDEGRTYYSYDLGGWHLVALDSNCAAVGGCGVGSPQEQWLRLDLARNPTDCTIGYWHHPRFSSGAHGSSTAVAPLWQALEDHGAEIILAGHDHDYERFAPQTAAGVADPETGIREFVVGTGGRSLYAFGTPLPNSQARSNSTAGVLKLTLYGGRYTWQFMPATVGAYSDSGGDECH
jgi:hypothetical protein